MDDLTAARATIASLQRQLRLRIEAVSFTALAEQVSEFDAPTVRRRPAIVRREVR